MVSLLAACVSLLILTASPLLAQAKDMGMAQQYYKGKNTRFRFSRDATKKDGTVKWSTAPYGKQELVKDEYAILEGEVKITYQDIILSADKITFNLKTKDAVAEGHVLVDQGLTRVSAERVFYNLDTKTGTFFNATGTFEPSINFTGEKMEKVSEKTYKITNGTFTSCDLDRPAWSFKVAGGTITLDDYAHLRGLEFKARRIPLFYTPYLVWPTKKDRSRGFLIPRIGYSKTFGSRLEVGYYIPFGDSVDTTFIADLHARNYLGVGVDFRYLPTPNIKVGELNAYTVHDPVGNKQQWKYSFKHAQNELPGHFRGVVDVQDYSDLDFFRRYDKDPILHTLSNIYSSAYLTKNRENYSINILADRRDIFLTTTLKQSFEQLPSLQFRLYPNHIGETPFYLSVESSVSHLLTSGLINGPTANYYRADIYPTLSMHLRTPAWFSIRPEISVRDTWYSDTLDPSHPNPVTGAQQTANQSLSRFYAQGQVEVVGPSFSKIINRELGGFTKFKHIIEPRFRYLYTTNVDDQNKVIRFDSVDSPFLPIVRDSVEYSLTQRLIGKEKGPTASSREILSFALRQSVSLGKPFDSQNGTSTSLVNDSKFSPLTASLHANPYQSISLDANASFGTISHQIDQTSLSTNLVSKDRYLSFTWFANFASPISTGPNPIVTPDSSQIRISSGAPFWNGKLRGDVQLNYDARQRKFLEQRFILGGTGSCYSLSGEYRRYFVYDLQGPKFLWGVDLAITLKNVGTISAH